MIWRSTTSVDSFHDRDEIKVHPNHASSVVIDYPPEDYIITFFSTHGSQVSKADGIHIIVNDILDCVYPSSSKTYEKINND